MAPRGASGGGPGRRPGVSAIRPPRPALSAAVVAGLLGACPIWYVAAVGGGLPLVWMIPIQVAGLLALTGAAPLGRPALVALGPLLLGSPAALALVQRGPELLAVPLGGALLLATEAAFLASDISSRGVTEAAAIRRRLLRVGGATALGMGSAAVVLILGSVPAQGGLDLTLLGIAAALGLLLAVGWLGRSRLRG